ncbi:tRNA (adenosine(37)-N6)-threonylcarbamoyltransferase complex dimerization subunit type 1 TsaB [Geopsychrobacter electrodiphilus]|uniref:tRNA (adenosine(37)-N6)-threonylcarbamoyltransferase complex dimerization subunit type 1 TsaB n=1 Tax=Geopsychrobacter electrodiphilus TaxID=225196 RepID=UPI00039A8F64|nr:tRNA (adenosine(37)-N6)-threonylcarbamoyltransferase complex dimerization subunit type 1 TsaB [Geopsychrobacter electrodiphilus]
MKILALDTASSTGSVALLDGSKLIAELLLNIKATHSERLLEQVQQVLHAGALSIDELDLIAVVHGPGSFTGLRIGLATAKGLAQAAHLPVIGVSALQLLAMNLPLCPVPICVFVDARKKEVYTALFHWKNGSPAALGPELVLPPEAALKRLTGPVALVGDAVALYRPLIDNILGERALFPADCHHQPRASAAAVLASGQNHFNGNYGPALLNPIYIRPSDAEINRSKTG